MEKERVSQPSTSKQQSNRDILHGKDGKRKGIHPFTSKQQREIFYMERMEKERVVIHLQANNKERYFTWKGWKKKGYSSIYKQTTKRDILHGKDRKRKGIHPFTSKQQRYFTWKGWKKKGYSSIYKQTTKRDILHGKDGKGNGIHPFTSKQQREIFYMERMEKERVFIHLQANNKERYFTWKGWKRKGYSSIYKQTTKRDILRGKDGKRKGIHPFTSKQQREIFYMERMEKERVFIHLQANNKERYFTWKGWKKKGYSSIYKQTTKRDILRGKDRKGKGSHPVAIHGLTVILHGKEDSEKVSQFSCVLCLSC